VGVARDDGLALGGHRNEFGSRVAPVVEFVERDCCAGRARRRRPQARRRPDSLVDLDVSGGVQGVGDRADGVAIGVLGNVLRTDA
jgi:hypothetical protein